MPLNVNIVKQDLLNKEQFLKILWSEVRQVWKGGFQLIHILDLLGMYFDAVLVKVKTFLLLFRLALAILCVVQMVIEFEQHAQSSYQKFQMLENVRSHEKVMIIWNTRYQFDKLKPKVIY